MSCARALREREEAPGVALVHSLPLGWPVRGEPEPSGFLHQMEARPTDGIRVVSEIPDVFPEDLPEEGRGVDEGIS